MVDFAAHFTIHAINRLLKILTFYMVLKVLSLKSCSQTCQVHERQKRGDLPL